MQPLSIFQQMLQNFREPTPDEFNCWFYDLDRSCYEHDLKIVPEPLQQLIQYPLNNSNISKHLYTMYKFTSNSKSILEAGIYTGISTLAFGLGVRENGGHLTSLDIKIMKEARNRIKTNGLEKQVSLIECNDLKYRGEPGSYDIIFIDTVHTYKFTMKEIKHFNPMLKPGGIMIFHDVINHYYENIDDIISSLKEGEHISNFPSAIPRDDCLESPVYKAINKSFFSKSIFKFKKEKRSYRLFLNLDGTGLGIVLKL